MESGDMMMRVFPSFAFKLWDIRGEFMGYGRPPRGVHDMVIGQS